MPLSQADIRKIISKGDTGVIPNDPFAEFRNFQEEPKKPVPSLASLAPFISRAISESQPASTTNIPIGLHAGVPPTLRQGSVQPIDTPTLSATGSAFELNELNKLIASPADSTNELNPTDVSQVVQFPGGLRQQGFGAPTTAMGEALQFLNQVKNGTIEGATGLEVGPDFGDNGKPIGYNVGQLIGFAGAILPVAKGVSLATRGFKALSPVARAVAREAIVGGTLSGAQQAIRGAAGQEVNYDEIFWDAAMFATISGAGTLIGGAVKKFRGKREATGGVVDLIPGVKPGEAIEPLVLGPRVVHLPSLSQKELGALYGLDVNATVTAAKSSEALASKQSGFPTNVRTTTNPAKSFKSPRNPEGTPDVFLTPPIIYSIEEDILKIVPIGDVNKSVFGEIGRQIENPIRMHGRNGTLELMYRPIKAAEHEMVLMNKETKSSFEKVVKDNIPPEKSFLGFKFGNRQASRNIGIFSTARQKGGLELLELMGITEIPTLTAGERKVYDFMRSELEGAFNDIQSVRIASGVKPFRRVQNYFSWFRNADGALRAGDDIRVSSVIDEIQNARQSLFSPSRQTSFRFGKHRVIDDYGPISLDAFGTFNGYMTSANKHIALTPEIARITELIDGNLKSGYSFRESNPAAWKETKDWINFVAGKEAHIFGPDLERGLRAVNRNLGFSILSFNLRSAGIQPTALVNTNTEIGSKYTTQGVLGMLKSDTRKFIMDNSKILEGREFEQGITAMSEGAFGTLGRLQEKTGTFGLKGLQILDMMTAQATWYGAYLRGAKFLKLSKKEAFNYADDVVIRTQASAARSDIAPLQRNIVGKTLSLFNTFVINNWGFLTKDVLALGKDTPRTKENYEKVFRYLWGATAVNVIYEDVIGTFSPLPNPVGAFVKAIDDDRTTLGALGSAAREILEVVPVVGGGIRYSGDILGAQIGLWKDLGVYVSPARSNRTLPELVGRTIGVPGTSQIAKAFRASRRKKKNESLIK